MRAVCARRQKGASLIKKAKWSLNGRESFTKLVNDVHGLIGDLTTLFAPTITAQTTLCEDEAAGTPDGALVLFKEIAGQDDLMLEASITKLENKKVNRWNLAMAQRKTNMLQTSAHSNTWNNNDNTKVVNQVAGDQTFNGGQTFSF
jgi:hypothetical protein